MPLEPGHRLFLSDPAAPKRGRLLDIGCGVGNFLAAARDAGFEITGVEFDASAVAFARKHYGLQDVFSVRPEEFREQSRQVFDVVTSFEVLEHQDDPQRFLETASDFLAPGGFLAVSVPNRERWQKGSEPLDYPPNHLTRWSPKALRNLLERNGFEVMTLEKEPLGIHRAAQVLSAGLRTGMASRVAGERTPTISDLAEMSPEDVRNTLRRVSEQPRHRVAAQLAVLKAWAMIPLATLLLPYLRLRGHSGLYLYCLAQKRPRSGGSKAGV